MFIGKLKHWKIVSLYLIMYDVVAIIASYFLALWIRFDCHYTDIQAEYFHTYMRVMPIYVAVSLVVFGLMHLYRSIWRFASYNELYRITIATAVTFILNIALTEFYIDYAFPAVTRMPISYYAFGIVFQFLFTVGVRFSYRFVLLLRGRNQVESDHLKHVMLIGAGEAGQMICRDIKTAKEIQEKVVCFIDDNPNKWGRYIDGSIIVGGRDKILEACTEYEVDKIYLTMPSAPQDVKQQILNICKETGCEIKMLPGTYQFVNDEISISAMKDVAVEDLLGRDPIKVNVDEILMQLTDKVVMVTGGGGSIGSELCRQIASHKPKQLIIFEVYENNAYDIQMELRKNYPELDLQCIIGSVRDSRKLWDVFEKYRPEYVYHAAAHKHVPLMEDSPCEAIKNNAIGTYKTAYAAMTHGCRRFVLISTDKAVNPTNIMGASKRLCEMIVQSFDAKIKEGKACEIPQLFTHLHKEIENSPEIDKVLKETRTEFVAVRFGNVLGSNGSVIPLFKKQILAGGPVTVTHPDIIRYFMTISEAVSLVLQAGTYAHGGEIFVLDMGAPMKIDDLARNLIKLSGHKPDVDIKIVYTGLRPGEKLYEEKLMAEEGLKKTPNDLIHIGQPIPFDTEEFLKQLDGLMDAAYKNKEDIRNRVEKIVTTYHRA